MSYPTNVGGSVICRPEPLNYTTGQSLGFTLLSDLHFGSANTDYDRIQSDLDTALAHGDRILINGDVIDGIVPSDQKRYTPNNLHPRLAGANDIVNKSVDWAFELLSPVALLIDMIGCGNHDDKIAKKYGTDPVLMLVALLNHHLRAFGSNHTIWYGGYTGYVDYRFRNIGQTNNKPNGYGQRYLLWYHHGSGGGSSLASAAGTFSRTSFASDADLVWLGHNHIPMSTGEMVMECPQTGYEPKFREVRYVRTGAYGEHWGGQTQEDIRKKGRKGNYVADSMLRPAMKGGARVVLTFHRKAYDVKVVQ